MGEERDTPWNPVHLAILKEGVSVWNGWKKENPEVIPDLREAGFREANLREANLRLADLKGADLRGTDLRGADLRETNLTGTNLEEARLHWADLRGANFTGAKLTGADLIVADLSGADLSRAAIDYAKFQNTNLTETRFDHAIVGDTLFEASTLGMAIGLDKIVHFGPAAVGTGTLEACGLDLPDAFLKGVGYKDWEILAIKLRDPNLRQDEVVDIAYQIADMRTQSPIQTNSVFLSYAREDSSFVDAIGERLDKDRVRYWRDRHDISVGPIEGQIERAINLNGTVLLVLSKNSIHSEWVEFEVRKARDKQRELQKERGKQVHVLCPVALDDSWESCPWPERLRQNIMEYHVLNCSDWEEKSFDKKYEKLRTNLGIYYFDQDRE